MHRGNNDGWFIYTHLISCRHRGVVSACRSHHKHCIQMAQRDNAMQFHVAFVDREGVVMSDEGCKNGKPLIDVRK